MFSSFYFRRKAEVIGQGNDKARLPSYFYSFFWQQNKISSFLFVFDMSDFRAIVLGFVYGFKDSVVGMTALLRLRSILEENQMEKQKIDMYSSRRIRDRRQADRKAKR